MIIHIDNDYKCHVAEAEGTRAYDVPFFDNKCAAYIEGYRYVPVGEAYTREDGESFSGEMIAPWKDSKILNAYQEQYESMHPELEDMQAALEKVGVTIDG